MKRNVACMGISALILAVGVGIAATPRMGPLPDAGRDPLSPWNGQWKSKFVCYDIEGYEQYRLAVEQVYKSAGDGEQSAVFTNKSADGSTETVHAVNLVRNGKLICRARKIGSDGRATGTLNEYEGRHLGSGHIIWHRMIGTKGFETFNEIVDGDTYWIHGVGLRDGDARNTEIYEGRYVRARE